MSGFSQSLAKLARAGVIAGLGGGALAVLAFGPRGRVEQTDGLTVVDYWQGWTGAEEQAMRQIVADFNATVGQQEHIYVRCLSMSSMEQKTLVATAAGVPPDVAGLYNQNIPQFAALDALEPLDDLAAAHGITAADYKKVFWDELHYEGKLFGLIGSAYDIALYYNKGLFQERGAALRAAGLDPDRAPRTIAELDAYAAALDTFDAHGRLVSTGYLPLEPGWYLPYTCLWFGGHWYDQHTGRFTFTDPAVVRAYEWIQGYSKRLGGEALTEFKSGFGNFDSPQNAFLAGTVAMEQQGTFLANFVHTQQPSMDGMWAAAPFPSAGGVDGPPVTYCNCDVLVIPRGAKHKAEAFEFMAFVNRQDEVEKLATLHCKMSALSHVSQRFIAGHPNPYIALFDELAKSPNARGTEPIPILAEVTAEMENFVQQLSLMQVTPAQGLAVMQARLQGKLDAFEQRQRKRGRK